MSDTFHVPFDSGIRQDVDPAVAPEGYIARVQNGRTPRAGGVCKRFGLKAVPTTVSATSQAIGGGFPHAAGQSLNRNVIATDGRVWAQDWATTPTWQEVGRACRHMPIKGHWVALDSNTSADSPPHVAAMTGSVCTVYASTTAGVRVVLCDEAMTQRYTTVISGRRNPRVFVVGTVYVVTYEESSGGATNTYGRALDPATLTLGGETAIATRQTANDRYDAAPYSSTQFVISFRSGALTWTIAKINLAGFGTAASRNVVVANTVHAYERVYANQTDGIYAAFYVAGAGTGTVTALNDALSTDVSAAYGTNAAQHPGMARRNATSVWLTWVDLSGGGTADDVKCGTVDTAATVTTTGTGNYALTLASLPFNGTANRFSVWVNSRVVVTGGAPFADRYTLLTIFQEDTGARSVLCPELTSDGRGSLSHGAPTSGLKSCGAVATIGTNRYFSAILSDIGIHTSVQILEHESLGTSDAARRKLLTVAGAAALAGGHLQEVTFGRVNSLVVSTEPRGFENGFIRDPFQLALTDLGAASGVLPVGLYQVQVVYAYIDTAGRIHRSAPSANQTITTGGAGRAIRVTLGSCLYTEREDSSRSQSTRAEVYCTVAGGAVFYKVSDTLASTSVVTVTVDVGVASPIDTTAEILYTSGNRFANRPIPSARAAVVSHDALWVAGLWDRRMIERSKTVLPNQPARFTRADQFRAIAPFDVTAIAELDDQILLLGPDGLCIMSADGPSDQGNPPLLSPTVLSNTGTDSPDSVIRIPPGVVFFGRRCFYYVPRGGGEPEAIGLPIQEDILSVSGAAEAFEVNRGDSARPASRLAAFVCQTTEGARTVFLDQDSLQWVSEDVRGDSLAPVQPGSVIGSWGLRGATNGTLVYLPADATDGVISVQELSNYDEQSPGGGQTPITTIVETVWLRPFGLQGWGYVRRVQLTLTAIGTIEQTNLTVEYARDGGAYATLTTLNIDTLGVRAREWTIPGDQPCNCIRFRVSDVGANPDAGVIYHGLSLDVDAAEGLARLIPARRA